MNLSLNLGLDVSADAEKKKGEDKVLGSRNLKHSRELRGSCSGTCLIC